MRQFVADTLACCVMATSFLLSCSRCAAAAHPELDGWVAWLRDTVGGTNGDWRFGPLLGPEGGIQARRTAEIADTFQETLLRYHRPLLEDGAIEYEFYNRSVAVNAPENSVADGAIGVHPAVDRSAFLLEPDGVKRHWVTNGVWDRSELDPMNRTVPIDAFTAKTIPLKENDWNHLRLQLIGDTVRISVNGRLVYRGNIGPANDRTLGLFHWADQSGFRVRNMVWTGDWPKQLPPLQQQELRGTDTDLLGRDLPQLTATFERNLAADDVLSDFIVTTSDALGNIEPTADGLLMSRPGTRSYNDIWIAPRVMIGGDFDITATYRDLALGVSENGASAIGLLVGTADDLTTHARVFRGVIQHAGVRRREIAQVEFNRFPPRGMEIDYHGIRAEASPAGRLRIARRGKVLSFLLAEGDSPVFRLLHAEPVSDVAVPFGRIRLLTGSYAAGRTLGSMSVLWTELKIHAADIRDLTRPAEIPRFSVN